MRQIKQLMFVFLATFGLTSCLKEDDMNIDPDNLTQTILTIEWPEAGPGNTINSGMQYFSGSNLLYSGSSESDTATIYVKIAGAQTLDHDITIKLGIDDTKLDVNFANDGIEYELMPDSVWNFVNDSYTIIAGERYATYKIAFFPSKFDPSKDYMLPVTVAETGGVQLSDNYGHIYFHRMYNPIAGAYKWDFIRYHTPTQDPGGYDATISFYGHETSFTPMDASTVMVPTGYFDGPNYFISFEDDGAGNLSNFNVVIDPDALANSWAASGITVVENPTIKVENNNTKFTVNYVVFNGAAYRNCTDVYYK